MIGYGSRSLGLGRHVGHVFPVAERTDGLGEAVEPEVRQDDAVAASVDEVPAVAAIAIVLDQRLVGGPAERQLSRAQGFVDAFDDVLFRHLGHDGHGCAPVCGGGRRGAGRSACVHVHLIPRRGGEVHDPRGGVRGVIPSKRLYDPA